MDIYKFEDLSKKFKDKKRVEEYFVIKIFYKDLKSPKTFK
jgi:hypothetical protein